MAEPWVTIIGLGEDGPDGLSVASRKALDAAEVIFGGQRHLDLIAAGPRGQTWPVPFTVDPVLAAKGRRVVVLASNDPFWFGAGSSLTRHLKPGDWVAHPSPSTFSLAAARLGWPLEDTLCFGLHAAPFARLLPALGRRVVATLRDGAAASDIAAWLTANGFGASTLHILEALGGPRERVRNIRADAFNLTDVQHPVAVAIDPVGTALPCANGLRDTLFAHDGQITKSPVRALTLSALAPRPDQLLWDLGAGSGSVSVEWCLAAHGARAIAVEQNPARAENIRVNIATFGLDTRMELRVATSSDALAALPDPDAVFIGGGARQDLLQSLWARIPTGTGLVINGVTLETEALLAKWHANKGGDLMRIELAEAQPLGTMQGWAPARPVVQWRVTR